MTYVVIGMILQIHEGHEAYCISLRHILLPESSTGLQAYTQILVISSVDAQKLNPKNLIDCIYVF
jgi:hypothetical protein